MMNFIKKSILYSGIIFAVFAVNLQARQFAVHLENETMRMGMIDFIDIKGHPSALEIPTYGQIRKAIAEKFGLDPHWSKFMIQYFDPAKDKLYFLKPYIENLSRKDRAKFFDDLEQVSKRHLGAFVDNSILLYVIKRPANVAQPEDDWGLDETTDLRESDPALVRKLQDTAKKYR